MESIVQLAVLIMVNNDHAEGCMEISDIQLLVCVSVQN